MENNEANRLKLAEAVWETLTLDDLHEQFIFQSIGRYAADSDQFEEDAEMMGLVDVDDQAMCVHCDESHDLDADHECKEDES